MSVTDARDPNVLEGYEPLVRTTALMIVADLRSRGMSTPDDDADDVMQLLRVKVWRAVERFDPVKVRPKKGESTLEARDRYVFMCLMDAKKDVFKKKRTLVLLIEDQAPTHLASASHDNGPRDAFDARYLSVTHEETFDTVEESLPLIPNTLSSLERNVMLLLYRNYTHREIAQRLGTSRGDVSSAVRGLRSKLADWQPADHAARRDLIQCPTTSRALTV